MSYSAGVVAFKFDHPDDAIKAEEVLKIRQAIDEMCATLRQAGGVTISIDEFMEITKQVADGTVTVEKIIENSADVETEE